MTDYLRPNTLDEALALVSQQCVVVAGATDVYPVRTQQKAWGQTSTGPWLDISALDELKGISDHGDHWRIGALTTWTDLVDLSLPAAFDALSAAALQVGGVQIQNRATLGGNLCNASPAADGVPPLLSLNASVELVSASGTRVLLLEDFIKGNRQTALKPDELLSAILVPDPQESRSGFYKLGARKYLVISIVMASVNLFLEDVQSDLTPADINSGNKSGVKTDIKSSIKDVKIRKCRIAVGACSAVAQRLPELEASLQGLSLSEALVAVGNADYSRQLSPIDDVRATANYRLLVAGDVINRAIQTICGNLRTNLEELT